MRPIALVVALGLSAVACAKGPSFEEFRSTVVALAGPSAQNCGLLRLREKDDRPLLCAKEAVAKKHPFLVIVQRQGIDSIVYSGIAQTASGALWNVSWDSDVGGGSRAGSSQRQASCSRIEFPARLELSDSIECVQRQ